MVAWTQAELAYSLATATLPCMMPFMMKFNTGMGTMAPETIIKQSQQDSLQYVGGSYELGSGKRSTALRSGDEVSNL